MRHLTPEEVHAQKVRELGLDPDVLDLSTLEGLTGALRRAASYLCPCSAGTLVRAVVDPLRGLVPDIAEVKTVVGDALEAMVSHGDLLEQSEIEDGLPTARLLIYAAPPSFVVRKSGVVILMGIASDHLLPLPSELEHHLEYYAHVRRLVPSSECEDLASELKQLGLREVTPEIWLRGPKASTSSQAVAGFDQALDAVPPSRDIPGLLILDPARPVRYYPKRWTEPKAQTGRFVARREQAYGADLWCYVQLANGKPERMIDLPLPGSRWRGCDEAWHLQMAIDAQRGTPQRFRATLSRDAVLVEFFSPVPAWARRRWDALGELVPHAGCLFAYRIPENEIHEEQRFMREALWLEEITET